MDGCNGADRFNRRVNLMASMFEDEVRLDKFVLGKLE